MFVAHASIARFRNEAAGNPSDRDREGGPRGSAAGGDAGSGHPGWWFDCVLKPVLPR
jgi:hypothetical protein